MLRDTGKISHDSRYAPDFFAAAAARWSINGGERQSYGSSPMDFNRALMACISLISQK
jgi:phage portal protein BeeE